jgi:hypothetical protein
MADTLVERVTGRAAGQPAPVALNLVMSDQSLLGEDESAAVLDGYGPIPASVARRLVGGAIGDPRSRATLRRLYRHPRSGALVAMESRSRRFPKGLAAFIGVRDQTCRTPYCDAPIRHRDHARPRNRGGPTSANNGLGMCERCPTPRNHRAGGSQPVTTMAFTQRNSLRPPGCDTDLPRHPCPARR